MNSVAAWHGMNSAVRQRGAAFLAALFAVVLVSLSLLGAATLWRLEAQREREAELLFTGREYANAIRSYAEANRNRPDRFPKSLDALVRDPNAVEVRRHLRRLYADPMTGRAEWGLVRDARGGITGVHSLSDRAPLKRAGFAEEERRFATARSHADWRFMGDVPLARAARAPGESGGAAGAQAAAAQADAQAETRAQVAAVQAADARGEKWPFRVDRCTLLRGIASNACAQMRMRWGAAAEAECEATARAQQALCASPTAPVPPLALRWN